MLPVLRQLKCVVVPVRHSKAEVWSDLTFSGKPICIFWTAIYGFVL
jgi:hypothetical protein